MYSIRLCPRYKNNFPFINIEIIKTTLPDTKTKKLFTNNGMTYPLLLLVKILYFDFDVAKIMLGPGRSGIGEPEDGTMKGYQFFRTQYLPKKVKEISENFGIEESDVLRLIREEMMNYIDTPKSLEKPKMAYGGRINRAYGSDELVEQASGIEGLDININPKGVKELDLRETGGFIPPVGVKEKADDIPAMLANNEFVFTADAVRGMGDGNVNKGAQRMYDMMKKLEKGGRV